jgi:hypothetical protein
LASRLGDVEHVLFGSLVEQMRRCGKAGCRCAAGDPHGPYSFFSQRRGRRGLRYVPAVMLAITRTCLQRGAHVEAVLTEISAINVELLARRALG